jgi:uncharacterized membrane protein YqjE
MTADTSRRRGVRSGELKTDGFYSEGRMDLLLIVLIVMLVVVLVGYPTYVRPRYAVTRGPDIVTVLVVILIIALLLGRWRFP